MAKIANLTRSSSKLLNNLANPVKNETFIFTTINFKINIYNLLT